MRIMLLTMLAAATAVTAILAGPATPGVFDDDTVFDLTLEAPLDELFARAMSDDDYAVTGTLSWPATSGLPAGEMAGVSIAERGHTSREPSECAFPKLKLRLPASAVNGTPFAGLHALKIGTHCGDGTPDARTPKYGRLAHEQAPVREALVYQLLQVLEVPTLLARPARVTYVSTGARARPPLTRLAMLLEDDDDAQRRVGGVSSIGEDTFGSAREQFDPARTARLAMAEALIGNFDWCLRMFPGDIYRCDERHPLWNVLAFNRADGTVLPLIYDFDLAGPVVGRHVWFTQVFDERFAQPPSETDVEVQAQLQRLRSLFDRPLLDATRAHFLRHQPRVRALIDQAGPIDDEGRGFARRYVNAFYQMIGDDRRFYGPVIVEGGHRAALDAEGTRPACDDSSLLPAGTPVSPPLEVRGDRSLVRVLDALWEWTGSRACDPIRTQPVWVPSRAIGTDYPR